MDISSCEHGITLGDECTECTMDIETVATAARAVRDHSTLRPGATGPTMGEQYGHVKISRKAYEKDRFWLEPREFSKWEAWEWMIQAAAWKAYVRPVGMTDVRLERGEFLGSLRFMADAWGWSIKKVRNFLELVTDADQIRAQRETKAGTVYLLVNYEMYQGNVGEEGTQEGTPRARRGHDVGTLGAQRKAVKAGKAIKANNGSAPTRPKMWKTVPADFVVTDQHRALAAELGVDVALQEQLFREHEFRVAKSDANRAFSQWLRRAKEYAEQRPARVVGPRVNEMPKSNAPRTGRPVRADGLDPEAEQLKREREENAAVDAWTAEHADDARAILEAIAEDMRTDIRWRGTPAGILQGVARGLYRTRVLERINGNGAAVA